MAGKTLYYCKGLVICHGLSEKIIAEEIKSRLRIPLAVYSKNNGRNSIQINGLPALFNSEKTFKSRTDFLKFYDNIEYDKKTLKNFKLFPVMDTDDADKKSIENYGSNNFLKDHWLRDYIHPIYTTPSLEDVLVDAGVIDHVFADNEKASGYRTLFIKLTKELGSNTEIVRHLYSATKKQHSSKVRSNISEFFEYCLEWAGEIKIR